MADIYIFDLVYTLIPETMSPLDPEMRSLLKELLKRKKVAIISGASFVRMEKQIISQVSSLEDRLLKNLYLLPSFGSSLYVYDENKKFKEVYSDHFLESDRRSVIEAIYKISQDLGITFEGPFGNRVDENPSLITFAALGQKAPLEMKKLWDPKRKKRLMIKEKLSDLFPDYEIELTGHTSLNVSKKGINKVYGINKLGAHLAIPPSKMVFIGDSFFKGGNDAPVAKTDIVFVSVKKIEETKGFIETALSSLLPLQTA